jgi:hypothetical protein
MCLAFANRKGTSYTLKPNCIVDSMYSEFWALNASACVQWKKQKSKQTCAYIIKPTVQLVHMQF